MKISIYNLEPVTCPYTGKIIFDQFGLLKPFPKTLLAYELDDVIFISSNFTIVNEIVKVIQGFNKEMNSNKYHVRRFQEECKIQFPWFNWDFFLTNSLSPLDFLSDHALVRLESPEDLNDSPTGISDIFYFAEIRHHDHILNHLLDIYTFVNRTISRLTKNNTFEGHH